MRGERAKRVLTEKPSIFNFQFSIFNFQFSILKNFQSERNGGDVDIGACLLDALSVRLGRCPGGVDL